MKFNPYIAGNPINGPKGFFGREDVFREVMQVLRHPQSNAIVLFGQRRIGKTSVLLQLERRLETSREYTPVYLDLQDKAAKPLAEVLYDLAQRIAMKVGKPEPERTQFDDTGSYFRQTFLSNAVNSASKNGLVLLFDEFDVLDSPKQVYAGQKFFPYLREWMSSIEGVKLVFVIGRRPEDLSIDTISTFKGVRASRVSLLERKDAEALITQSHQNESLTWTDKAIEKVWEWTQGHPYLTQLLCSVVWENFYDADSSHQGEVQTAEVDAAIDKTLQQGANAFHWIWDGLPPAERVVMAAMAEAPNAVITQDKLIEILNQSGVRLIVRELELAPETLTEWQLLRPSEGGYRFVVPLLRQWVLNHRPLKRVKEELDRLDPQAEGLFQTGQRFYAMNDLAEAERQLRLALRINPNHLKSRLLLGRVLLESDKVSDSVAILEEAYRYDERATRLDLIKALLALADGQSEADQINTYARVLAIDQAQPLAIERRRMMWLKRGEAALQQDALDLALTAFKEAGETERFEHVLQLKRKRELVTQIESAKKYEQEEQWEAASAVYENLLKELPEEVEWKTQLQHAKNQAYLAQHYNDARLALENKKTEVAIELLRKVIERQPNYKDAALYLVAAISSVDVALLKQDIVAHSTPPNDTQPKSDNSDQTFESLGSSLDYSASTVIKILSIVTGSAIAVLLLLQSKC